MLWKADVCSRCTGKHLGREGGWAGSLGRHRRAISSVDAGFAKSLERDAPARSASHAAHAGPSSLPRIDRLTLDEEGGRDSPGRQRRHSRYRKSLEMP